MAEQKSKTSIFNKMISAGEAFLDLQIKKAKNSLINNDEEFYYKSVTEDPSFQINSQGYKEKPHRLLDSHLKQMSTKDSIISSIILTRQNQVSNYSRLVKSEQERGFIIVLKDEEKFLKRIKEELAKEVKDSLGDENGNVVKSEIISDQESEYPSQDPQVEELANDDSDDEKTDNEVEEFNWELERKAREKLDEEIRERRKKVESFIQTCGELENRPFETKKWNFDSCVRAWTRDRYTYDKIATEVVPNKVGKPHHFFPIDASTIKFATPQLKKYKAFPGAQNNVDLLYPEKHLKALEDKDVLELDDDLLEADKYKYVQVVRGRIERAYTEDEMKFGMANMTTDIYNNGYSVAELELIVSLVSSHLNTEYYNKAYFTQGFSAKGILHLKAPIPRRKLEAIRQQWHHMIKGNRNSFQTPIFAGMDEVNWIPLTQNHSDIEFSGWMNYLIKMICAIYQIDPYEIGIGMKDEGKSGMSGDNTEQKLDQSKDKGLFPLLRFLENYINENIISLVDSDFKLKFTGLDSESKKFALERQKSESLFKKTVNEIRAEDGLPPLPGMDDIILSPQYLDWYKTFSKKGRELAEKNQAMGGISQEGAIQENNIPSDEDLDSMLNEEDPFKDDNKDTDFGKSLKIEYYKLKK